MNNETVSEYLRSELIPDKISELSIDKTNTEQQIYLRRPYIVSCLDSRSDVGSLLLKNQAKNVEICWFFTLTKEKMRLKCNIEIVDS